MGAEAKDNGGKGGMIVLVLLTLVAIGAGAGHGLFMFGQIQPPPPKPVEAAQAAAPAPAAHGDKGHGAPNDPKVKPKLPSKLVTRDLPPLITNIQMPQDMWVRLEGTLVFDQAEVDNPETLVADVSGDLIGFLRSLTLRELQGADGLMFLRQDLKERISLRSDKKVRDFVIQALVVQ